MIIVYLVIAVCYMYSALAFKRLLFTEKEFEEYRQTPGWRLFLRVFAVTWPISLPVGIILSCMRLIFTDSKK